MNHSSLQGFFRFIAAVLLCGLLTGNVASAAPISGLAQMHDGLGRSFEFLADPGGKLELRDVIAMDSFQPIQDSVINLGFDSNVHWFRLVFSVEEQDLLQKWFADIDYPVLDFIDMYLWKNGELMQSLHSGDQVKASQRPAVSRTLLFPLALEAPGAYSLYIRLDSQSAHTLPLMLITSSQFAERSARFSFWMGLYFGVILITVLFSALVALITRGQLFVDYSAFVFFAGLGLPLSLTGYGSQFLWGEWPWLSNAMTPLSMGIALFFALSLTRQTLAIADIGHRLSRILRIEQWICVAVAVSPLIADYALGIRLGTITGGAVAVSVILASIKASSHNQRTAQLFLVAWSWYLIAVLVKVLTVFGFAPFNIFTNYAMQLGLSVLIVFLAAALGDLLNADRKRMLKAQLQSMRDANDRRQAEMAARTRTDFLAKMSHELRTPMNAVIGFSELGMRRDSADKRVRYLSQIHSAANSLLALINDILDFSKVESGHLELESAPVCVQPLFEKLRAMFELQAERKDIDFVLEYEDALPQWIEADALRLEQILINLMSNAIKFTEFGGVEVFVTVLRDEDGEQLQVRVRDTGVGIDKHDQNRLFQAFTQADETITRRFGGTGLGLVISKQLVSLMGGDIGVISRPGQGSEFWFRVPLQAIDPPTDWVANSDTVHEMPALADLQGERLSGLKILLVEDNALNQILVQELLGSLDVEITMVENGRLAVEEVQNTNFDLVLMDVFMPEMDGYTATRKIREMEGYASLPIIAVSASVADQDRQSCFDAGMDDFVAKPIRAQELIQCILQHSKGERAAAKARSPTALEALPVIPDVVFDAAEGRSYCNEDETLYGRLLQDFLQRYAGSDKDIADLLAKEQRTEARRLAHTVKGLAASLGMKPLQQQALRLENAVAQSEEEDQALQEYAVGLQQGVCAAQDYLAARGT
ncbi:MAG: 7TM diverse intracellular signaling domain-containing protein [Oceanococcus sp.]